MDTQNNAKHSYFNKGQVSLIGKLVFIFIIILLLMIPSSMIESLIWERKTSQNNVAEDIGRQFGSDQYIKTPILAIPITSKDTEGKLIESTYYLTANKSKVHGKLGTEIRHKSIYDVIVYKANVKINGTFDISNLPINTSETYNFDKAYIVTGLSDNASLIDKVNYSWNDTTFDVKAGTINTSIISNGIHAQAPLFKDVKVYNFSMDMNLKGSGSINILPTARTNEVVIEGNWADPGFTGNISPQEYTINEESFQSKWSVYDFGMSIPESWVGGGFSLNSCSKEYFGVKLVSVVDHYQKNMRAVKYAFMIIVLSFVSFFFFEVFKKVKVHPIQYILIGAALTLFYSLLLSFSEHIGFSKAYLVSSVAIIFLISMYTYYILNSGKGVLVLASGLAGLYGYIFVLLQLESYALLVGSIGLFVILFLIMFLSRKIDWYNINKVQPPVVS